LQQLKAYGYKFDNWDDFDPKKKKEVHEIKIVLIGDTEVGKTCLTLKYCNER
jgi:GTPase SAR1 family protein